MKIPLVIGILLFCIIFISGCVQQKKDVNTYTCSNGTAVRTISDCYFDSISEKIISTSSTTTSIQNIIITQKKIIQNVNTNFTTPELRTNNSYFISGNYSVYINDSFLKIVDPYFNKSIYNDSIDSIKKAFKIWEEETGFLKFDFINSSINATIYVQWSGDMPTQGYQEEGASQTIGYAIKWGYECSNYRFIKGGMLVLSIGEKSGQLLTDVHEIGHLLNLADTGNLDTLMSTYYQADDSYTEQKIRSLISDGIKETLSKIVKPGYDCYKSSTGCPGYLIHCNNNCYDPCEERGLVSNCTSEGMFCEIRKITSTTIPVCSAGQILCQNKCYDRCEGTFICDGDYVSCIESSAHMCPYDYVNCQYTCINCSSPNILQCYDTVARCLSSDYLTINVTSLPYSGYPNALPVPTYSS